MQERMHPLDLRALMASIIAGTDTVQHGSTSKWVEYNVGGVDALLAELERTAPDDLKTVPLSRHQEAMNRMCEKLNESVILERERVLDALQKFTGWEESMDAFRAALAPEQKGHPETSEPNPQP